MRAEELAVTGVTPVSRHSVLLSGHGESILDRKT